MVGRKKAISLRMTLGLFLLGFILVLSGCEGDQGKFKVGISQLVENPVLDLAREGFIKALEEEGNIEDFKIDTEIAQGDISLATTIAEGFKEDEVDLIFTIATPSAQSALNSTKDIPILFTAVTDPKAAGLVENLDRPEGNISGVVDLVPMEKQLRLGMLLRENSRTVGIPFNNSEVNSQIQIEEARKISADLGLEIIEIPINNSSELEAALNSQIDKLDFLFLPSDNLIAGSMGIIQKVSLESKVPAIGVDKPMIEKGALACEGLDYFKLGYDAGLMALKIKDGEKMENLKVLRPDETDLIVNLDMAEKLGIEIPKEILDRAVKVGGSVE